MLNLKSIFPKFYDFYIDFLYKIQQKQDLGVDEINFVGSRKSGKSLNAEMFFILAGNMFSPLDGKPIRCDTFAFRYETKDKAKLFADFLSAFERLEKIFKVKLNARITKNKIYFPKTKSTIWIDGLTTKNAGKTKFTGLQHSSADYIFKFFEERAEFPNNDIQDIDEAVRGIENYRMLAIACSNPKTLSNEYVWLCHKHLPFSEARLRDKHFQFLAKNLQLNNDVINRVWFVYNNWRVIDNLLTPEEKSGISKSWNISYQRGLWADIGYPSSEAITIYGAFLDRITKAVYEPHDRVGGGGDIGQGKSKGSGITSFVFCAVSKYGYADVYAEWTHDNKINEIVSDKLYPQIVEFYINNWIKYQEYSGQRLTTKCVVRVDFSEKAFIDGLNATAQRIGCSHWLIFIKNSKKPEINDRVIYEKYQMSKYRLRIDKERCPNLMNEFASAEWEEKLSVKLKRKDDKDHGINSYEYFLEPEMTINYIISPNDYGEYAKDMRMKS